MMIQNTIKSKIFVKGGLRVERVYGEVYDNFIQNS